MFALNEDEISSIRAAFDGGGEFAAAVELQRLFPGISDLAQDRRSTRTVVGWTAPSCATPAGTAPT